MPVLDLVSLYIEYHNATTRRVWDGLDALSDAQFVKDDTYSRGSIRNFMVHLASTDRRWLAGLRELPDVGHLKFEDYPTRAVAREVFETVARDLAGYMSGLTENELARPAQGMKEPRWQVLLHMANHGTDHRATVLEKMQEFGAPTFGQDFIFWLWERKKQTPG